MFTLRENIKKLIPVFIILPIIIVLIVVILLKNNDSSGPAVPTSTNTTINTTPSQAPDITPSPTIVITEPPVVTTPPVTESPATPLPEFNPYAVDSTKPSNMMNGNKIDNIFVEVNDVTVPSYTTNNPIDFSTGDVYSSVEGIITFRGNNFRDSGSYGTVNMTEFAFEKVWMHETGKLEGTGTSSGSHMWYGCGWTGQPLAAKWPKSTRAIMNMYDWAKEAEELVEVIYATMDGNIYFYELYTGQATRPPMNVGHIFKGAGALDPRGYPLMYCGSGDASQAGTGRAFIINLIDCSILYEFGIKGDPFAKRSWTAYDSSALVDAETDTLIYPGENGVVYFVKLNSEYKEAEGSISINPEITKWRYYGKRSSSSRFYIGIEASAVAWRGHLFLADNGGHLMCLNINTLELVWVQDLLDDTNCTPVLELENGHPYLYVSTSFHGGWRYDIDEVADVPVMKIDAVTGEVVWRIDYPCYTVKDVSGGVQGTIAIGKNNVSDLIFVPVARYPTKAEGRIVAINKSTGDQVWSYDNTPKYSWSSPTVVYNSDGDGYIIWASTSGYIYIIDARTGVLLNEISLKGGLIEATPIVYDDMVVIGTKGMQIHGVKLK